MNIENTKVYLKRIKMFKYLKLFFIYMLVTLFLNACVNSGKNAFDATKDKIFKSSENEFDVGVNLKKGNLDQDIELEIETALINHTRNLNIIIPAFHSGIDKNKEVFKELRNFESRRFAVKLKIALENTNRVGAVRVTPDTGASGQIYIIGTIKESNGYKVHLEIKVIDASGKKIMEKKYAKKIKDRHYNDSRTKNKDAYNELFEEVAISVVKKLERLDVKKVNELVQVSNLRFGAEFSPESFTSYLERKSNKYSIIALPSEDDPMWQRINSIKIREQLFVDSLQSHYDKFVNSSNQSYVLWQRQSYNEIIAENKAKKKALGRSVLGVLSIAAAVASATSPYNRDDYTNEVGMLALGGKLLEDAAKFKAEAKMHQDSIRELGNSIDSELAPNVIEFENKTVELSGNAKQQFLEWRKFLKKMYEIEKNT